MQNAPGLLSGEAIRRSDAPGYHLIIERGGSIEVETIYALCQEPLV